MSELSIQPTPSAYAYPLLVKHLLHTPLRHAPNQEIVYGDILRYDYRTLVDRVGRLARGLESIGIAPGHTVAVMDWDSHRYLECFFAVPMMGAVLHTVNVRLAPEQIAYTINHAEDDAILVHVDFLPLIAEIKGRIEKRFHLVVIADGNEYSDTSFDAVAEYEQMLADVETRREFADFDEHTRATTFYTTGTTGDPKGVYYSHRQLVIHTLGAMAAIGSAGGHGRFHRDDVYMPITPMFHVHAWGVPYMATMMGVKQVYPGRYSPEGLLGLIEREGVTFSHCVPTILQMLLDSPAIHNVDLRKWKIVIGGSALPRALARKAMSLGIDVYSGYGLSETGPVLALAQLDARMLDGDSEEQLTIRTKTGRPLPLVDLRVVDENGNEVPHDAKTTGEVVVRAPWLTGGYLKDPTKSEHLWRNGYLHTGDIGHVDDNGYLQITDRIKDVIKSGGEWISSLQLEDIVSQHEGVSESAAIGVPDERWGERPLVLVVRAPEYAGDMGEETLKEHVRSYVARGVISSWAIPDRVEFVDAIDKTSVGKIDKKLLRQKYS